MIIGLHTPDRTDFPSLPLMKIAAAHRANGHTVERFASGRKYDRVYSSKVFTWSEDDDALPPDALMGGTGYGSPAELPESVEHVKPDYSLYRLDYSVGFLTRGCNRNCDFCGVRAKEGYIRPNADVTEFLAHRDVVLLDNNVLAHPFGIAQIEKMARLGLRVDFNQGLDARLIDDAIARQLAKLKWRAPLRMACDTPAMLSAVERATRLLRWHNVSPRRYFVYVLVRDVSEAVERVKFLKGLNLDPFAQPYIPKGATRFEPSQIQRWFVRWCNVKPEYNSRTWEEYLSSRPANAIRTGAAP